MEFVKTQCVASPQKTIMLDTTTKKRIDDCRDILVGKLPDPKAQIEQITIGLIYKFMDDMDKEAIDLGGKAKFFADYSIPDPENPKKKKVVPFSQYSWDNLFNAKVTAAEMLRLYSEAIQGMDKNPNIPQLFRDIFKNAFLPYRDPETLKLFLKTIGEFEYTHSEKLGDAFEYLLSVMGSQGDAGQFRTPRHIIDFLVAVVNPGKKDTILDPACGTAGFLISAFKHIKDQNKKGLTPDERKKLIQNFTGYDISPDMVRLSLVNLYLHGFNDPHIWEYDTLSSEERWDETYDVILANPPFMSPKGGIRPHKKFSISSNRSEVLFVDYIAEHLNPKGRAGIIVPEGVIFQGGTAYKELRKMLVENYLYAVVSLPAGVFNPYSGVKTSILLMDKEFAKSSKEILFVKIENDGYSLGAQRTPVKGSQLEEAIAIISGFRHSGLDPESVLAHSVAKNEIAKKGDYNLSGDRYKTNNVLLSHYPIVELGSITNITTGKLNSNAAVEDGKYPFFTCSKEVFRIDNYAFDCEALLLAGNNAAGIFDVKHYSGKFNAYQRTYVITIKEEFERKVLYTYLKHLLEMHLELLRANSLGSNTRYLVLGMITSLKVPLPPLSIQEEIVAEIEGWQKIIDGAKAVVENYKPKIDINPDWEMVELGGLCEIKHGFAFKSEEFNADGNTNLPLVLAPGNFSEEGGLYFTEKNSRRYSGLVDAEYLFKKGDLTIIMTDLSPKMKILGNPAIIEADNILHNQRIGKIILKDESVIPKYLYYCLFLPSVKNRIKQTATGTLIRHTSPSRILESLIPLPPIETQRQIVSQMEKEQALVNANKQLIEIFEQKIKDRIAKVWGAKASPAPYKENEQLTLAAEE